MLLFKDRLFLITSNGELKRNRHDIYAQAYKINKLTVHQTVTKAENTLLK
jgi:hypothetical protein